MLKGIFTSQRQLLNHFFEKIDLAMAEMVLSEFLKCQGIICLVGVGKSGHIADKIAKTMMSTGTRAISVSPTGAVHGDFGIIGEDDLVVFISKSGQSSELVQFATAAKKKNVRTMAWVCSSGSPLANLVDFVMQLPIEREICPHNLAPTTSAAVQLIFGDVMAVALMDSNKFSLEQYAINHPAGFIGKQICERVSDVMNTGDALPLCGPDELLQDVLVELSKKRLGCLIVVDKDMRPLGIFTDGDLRRSLEEKKESILKMPMGDLMTRSFLHINPKELTSKALQVMEGQKKIMMLPVIENDKLVGILHMHSILSCDVPVTYELS